MSKTLVFPLLIALMGLPPLVAQAPRPAPIEIAPLPPNTVMEKRTRVAGWENPDPGASAQEMIETIYKTPQDRISVRTWPGGNKAYQVITRGWMFYTDPVAPPTQRDVVQIAKTGADQFAAPDFPEITFALNEAAVSGNGGDQNKSVILLTGPEKKPTYTEEYIRGIEAQLGNSPERESIIKNLREAQKVEQGQRVREPDRFWLDGATHLPIRSKVNGTETVYTYRTGTPPSLPDFMRHAIEKKFAKSAN
jgi:hypothetical protein